MTDKRSKKRILNGKVVSDKMEKTIAVRVVQTKIHPLYHKRYQISKKYHAHDAKQEYKVGDTVQIEESRPRSKTKRWKVIKKSNQSK